MAAIMIDSFPALDLGVHKEQTDCPSGLLFARRPRTGGVPCPLHDCRELLPRLMLIPMERLEVEIENVFVLDVFEKCVVFFAPIVESHVAVSFEVKRATATLTGVQTFTGSLRPSSGCLRLHRKTRVICALSTNFQGFVAHSSAYTSYGRWFPQAYPCACWRTAFPSRG